ncbi:MAG: Hpt domain-containing protein [Phycisphaerales bacterium]|nr:Hpt domain-containing protein [Phycisphaerales bacterium]
MTNNQADYQHFKLHSSAANDLEIRDLIELFVREMPGRIKFANDAFMRGDRLRLQFWAHQLKGSAGGYGFAQITIEATKLENTIIRNESADCVFVALRRVLDLCERATIE